MTRIKQSDIRAALAYQAPSGHPLREYKPKERKKSAGRKYPEYALQEMLVQWLDTQPRIMYWANNPQVFTGKMTWAKQKYLEKMRKRGHKKGVPDLCLLFCDKVGRPVFCFAEVKSLSGTATEEQSGFMAACERRGGYSAIVKSLEDLRSLLDSAGY